MGIKIRNDTPHNVIVLVFAYIFMPHPSLFYRKTLVIPSGTRVNCPTLQSAVKIYAWEADENAYAIASALEKEFVRINTARLALVPLGGELLGSLVSVLDIFAESVADAAVERVIEVAVNSIIANLEEQLDRMDENLEQHSRQAIQVAREQSRGAFMRTMTKKRFFITQNALFLRRQFHIHHNNSGQLKIDGAGIAWFD